MGYEDEGYECMRVWGCEWTVFGDVVFGCEYNLFGILIINSIHPVGGYVEGNTTPESDPLNTFPRS